MNIDPILAKAKEPLPEGTPDVVKSLVHELACALQDVSDRERLALLHLELERERASEWRETATKRTEKYSELLADYKCKLGIEDAGLTSDLEEEILEESIDSQE